MPWLVADAVAIIPREREAETVEFGVSNEPVKLAGAGETRLQVEVLGRAEIEGSARVVFAETGGGDETEDSLDGRPGGELGADDRGLARDATEAGER